MAPDKLAFDKAEHAEQAENLAAERDSIAKALARLGQEPKSADWAEKPAIEAECARLRHRLERIGQQIEPAAEKARPKGDAN